MEKKTRKKPEGQASVTLFLSNDLVKVIDIEAKRREHSRSDIIRDVLRSFFFVAKKESGK